ncbi:hypothetical protein [Mycobacterium sp. 852002-51961_SCH5331710]|uniref:hypothetical protein n=1 Tax=Mycobacterium sp. 852002-51961_SCH5331710 TaxID=1834105 RepID=UPI000800FB8B|nr:hypothetical protein [Mycobacterium sp. 852002-51961_SCH5331710]OBB42706.1 hypothetical protein A5752_06225 [Mycobacterium sp. 852002-51961_SCH5331710]
MTQTACDVDQAAKHAIDSARDHIDTSAYYLHDAIGHLDGARRTRAQQIHDNITSTLAALDRLRETL